MFAEQFAETRSNRRSGLFARKLLPFLFEATPRTLDVNQGITRFELGVFHQRLGLSFGLLSDLESRTLGRSSRLLEQVLTLAPRAHKNLCGLQLGVPHDRFRGALGSHRLRPLVAARGFPTPFARGA
jgi:hypothetical protein